MQEKVSIELEEEPDEVSGELEDEPGEVSKETEEEPEISFPFWTASILEIGILSIKISQIVVFEIFQTKSCHVPVLTDVTCQSWLQPIARWFISSFGQHIRHV